jgi:hypothetical protein
MSGERVFRCEIESRFQNQLVQNIYHVRSTIPLVFASQVAITTMEHFIRRIMQLQVYNLTYERMIVTCLNADAPHMYVMDLENERPGTDVVALPLPISWKWTGRNLTPLRNFIGGFYIGGLRSIDFNYSGEIAQTGVQQARAVRDAIMAQLGVGGNQVMQLGTFSRRLNKQFPLTSVNDFFVPWASLNFNSYYTSMRKRTPGVGR